VLRQPAEQMLHQVGGIGPVAVRPGQMVAAGHDQEHIREVDEEVANPLLAAVLLRVARLADTERLKRIEEKGSLLDSDKIAR
jgi:hypothetical protein